MIITRTRLRSKSPAPRRVRSIRYTKDGSEPTATSAPYTQPIVLDCDAVIRAQAFKEWFDPKCHRLDFVSEGAGWPNTVDA